MFACSSLQTSHCIRLLPALRRRRHWLANKLLLIHPYVCLLRFVVFGAQVRRRSRLRLRCLRRLATKARGSVQSPEVGPEFACVHRLYLSSRVYWFYFLILSSKDSFELQVPKGLSRLGFRRKTQNCKVAIRRIAQVQNRIQSEAIAQSFWQLDWTRAKVTSCTCAEKGIQKCSILLLEGSRFRLASSKSARPLPIAAANSRGYTPRTRSTTVGAQYAPEVSRRRQLSNGND